MKCCVQDVISWLIFILFIFPPQDWSIRYNQDEPVAPRYEVNAPDLYIPCKCTIIYICLQYDSVMFK